MHFAFDEIGEAWNSSDSFIVFVKKIYNYPLYRALSFTLIYTFVVTPFVLFLGFLVALGVNNLPKLLKGPTIFASLLPMIVTPLVGSLILFWMVQKLFPKHKKNLSKKTNFRLILIFTSIAYN